MLHELTDVVMQGKRVGRRLGTPTANLPYPTGEDAPPDGIYVARVILPQQGGRVVNGVLSQGKHPTLPEGVPTVEVHLFDFDESLYGQKVIVQYLKYLRPEKTFASVELMRAQIARDISAARAYFAATSSYPE
ncbi:MAG TPA: hypothetical protein GX722_04240 [Clostridiales bacterium]|jgi:riboflavin kinase/FMN adenylyltransferase|nr:hypothetical protein [Clostridiales bacterium]